MRDTVAMNYVFCVCPLDNSYVGSIAAKQCAAAKQAESIAVEESKRIAQTT